MKKTRGTKKEETKQPEAVNEEVIFTGISNISYKALKVLGRGTFGIVYEAEKLNNPNEKFAIKRYFKTFNPNSGHLELSILSYLTNTVNDKRILKVLDGRYLFDSGEMFMVTPFLEHKKFNEYYKDLSLEKIQIYMHELLYCIKLIHGVGIIHRDIKPDNFLFNINTNQCCLIDFGLAEPDKDLGRWKAIGKEIIDEKTRSDYDNITKLSDLSSKHKLGTRGFIPPEVIFHSSEQSGAVDIWAAGVIFLTFLAQRFPIFNLNQFTKINNDTIKDIEPLVVIFGKEKLEEIAKLNKANLYIGDVFDKYKIKGGIDNLCAKKSDNNDGDDLLKSAKDLLKSMLELNHKKRITADDALKHPFFNTFNNNFNIIYSNDCSTGYESID